MEYVITVVVTLLATLAVTALKPEWIIGWLLKFLETKIPKNSNAISNALGYTLMNVGSYALASQKDTQVIEEANKKIKDQLIVIEKELKKYWIVGEINIVITKTGFYFYTNPTIEKNPEINKKAKKTIQKGLYLQNKALVDQMVLKAIQDMQNKIRGD